MYPKLFQIPIDFISDKTILIIIISAILSFIFYYLRHIEGKKLKKGNTSLYKVFNGLFYFFLFIFIILGLLVVTGQKSMDFNSYGFMLALAFLLGVLLVIRKAKKVNIPKNIVSDIALWGLIASVIGARLFFMLFEYSVISDSGIVNPPMAFFSNLFSLFDISSGGFVAYGGFICGVAVSIYYIKKNGLPLGKTADIFAPSLALGVGFARLGCNFAGCCFGLIDKDNHFLSIPLSLFDRHSHIGGYLSNPTYDTYTHIFESGLQNSTFIFPTQLISAISGFFIFFILEFIYTRYRNRFKFEGLLFLIFALYYSVSRFLIEIIRNDTPKNIISLSAAQFTGIIIFALASTLLIYNWIKANTKKAEQKADF